MTNLPIETFNLLRRLQQQNDLDIPVNLGHRSAANFSLEPVVQAPELPGYVNVTVYPQDPFVGEPEVRQLTASYIQPGLSNARFQIVDHITASAKPDAQGNYIFHRGSPEFDQINSFYYATFTLRMYERYAQRKIGWSFGDLPLIIDPHAGTGGNAYYSEFDHLLGFNGFQDGSELIQSAQSADIVSHETGHAVLDGLRDLYNESFGLGANAFHESFGDMTAILVALHDDSLIQRLLDWTGGDLHIDNFIAAVAEQVTTHLQARGEKLHGRTVYLRNALNKFTDISFDSLPSTVAEPIHQLSREKHNYSRLFTGAFYDILVAVYERVRQTPSDHLAIHTTRDIVGSLLVTAIELGPVCELTFADIAKAFVTADDVLNGGKYTDILIEVFSRRKILSAEAGHDHIAKINSLPILSVTDQITSSESALAFLRDHVMQVCDLPTNSTYTPFSTYRNASGLTYMTYVSARRMSLTGNQFEIHSGTQLDVYGGLTLAFDSKDRLRSICHRPVLDEDLRQIRIMTSEWVGKGQIVPFTQYNLHSRAQEFMPIAFDVAQTFDINLLLKNPLLLDRFPLPSFWEYLRVRT